MDAWTTAQSLLPPELLAAVRQSPAAEEIRLRLGQFPALVLSGREQTVRGPRVTQGHLLHILEKATGASLYAAAPALKNGFVSYRGLRIGVCGEAVYTQERLTGLRSFSSLSIRIPHAFPAGCGTLLEGLLRPHPASTLIISPPGGGKTSLLRELIRHAASQACRVCVIDDRNELSASVSGVAQFDLGPGSDILVGVPKAQAAGMLLRGMNPQIIAMDEITREEDLNTVEQISGCGVLLFAAAHASDREDMRRRPLYRKLLEGGAFRELVTIRVSGGKRLYTRETLG